MIQRTILSGVFAAAMALAWQPAPEPPAPPRPPSAMGAELERALRVSLGGSFLGVGVAEVDAERAKALKLKEERGVEITNIEEGSPAAKAGLQKGDVVIEFNGQRVEGTEQFVRLVRETPAGRQIKLSVNRGGVAQTVAATVEKRKLATRSGPFVMPRIPNVHIQMPDIPRAMMSWRSSMLGIEAESVDSQLAEYFGVKEGVLVRSVLKASAAEKAGLKAGDVITKVDAAKVSSPREITNAIRSKQGGAFPLTLVRDRKEMTLNVTLEEPRSEREIRPRTRTVLIAPSEKL
ncbi:MAG: PDZ domain-containing protein [Bryobacterales bacterium]|nr:PDZ domain-containing protein [Bryobacterales bacterium]